MNLKQTDAFFAACPAGPDPVAAAAAFGAADTAKNKVKVIGVSGAAGKTAIAEMEAAILNAAGFAAGLYTAGRAPLSQRIRIRGAAVTPETYIKAAEALAACETSLPRAAAELACAMACFAAEQCAFAAIELPDTMLAAYLPDMPVCAVAQLGADGTGHSLERIAHEAADILRRGSTAVTTPSQPKAALQELIVTAGKTGCELIVPEADDLDFAKAKRLANEVDYGGYSAALAAIGRPAAEDMAVAVELALALWHRGTEISDEAILQGLAAVDGRYGIHLVRRRPNVFADPCHKPLQAAALAGLMRAANFDHVTVIAALSGCDDPDAFFAALETGFIPEEDKDEKNQMPGMSVNAIDKLYLVTPDAPDAVSAKTAAAAAKFHFDTAVCADMAEAAKLARADAGEAIFVIGGAAACRAAEAQFAVKK